MHDLNQVSGTADRVALLVDGCLHAIGKPEEVLTPGNINETYQTKVESFHNPRTGKHYIFPMT